MADYYIRAPVRLYFHIPSRVAASLVQISADTNVGEQTTSRVSILGCDEDIECCQRCQLNKTDGSKTNEEKDLYSRDKFTVLGMFGMIISKRNNIYSEIDFFSNTYILPFIGAKKICPGLKFKEIKKNIQPMTSCIQG